MNLFVNHSIEQQNNEIIVTLYIDKRFGYEEFSSEFLTKRRKHTLENQIKEYLLTHLPQIKGGIVKVAFGTMILTVLPIHTLAEENQNSLEETEYVIHEVELTTEVNGGNPESVIEASPDSTNTAEETDTTTGEEPVEIGKSDMSDLTSNSAHTTLIENITYNVQAGDTLTSISKLFNVSIDQIKIENGLTSDRIYIGQKLSIPGTATLNEEVEQVTPTTYFEEGMKAPEIIELKKNLNKIGFGKITVTSYFGSFTTKKVAEFQKYYGLKETGIADESTIQKIKEVANSPHQLNKRNPANIQLKKDLNSLGFGHIAVTELYGAYSERKVKEFQEYYGLNVSGIADDRTLEKIQELLITPLKEGIRRPDVIDLKKDLNAIGYGGISLTEYFGSFTERRIKEFQKDFHLPVTGVADQTTINKIKEIVSTPYRLGVRDNQNIQLKKNLNTIGFGGITVTSYYGSLTEKRVKEFQEYYGLPVTGIADTHTRERIHEILSSPHQLGKQDDSNIELKEKLNQIGFGQISVTPYFGSFSEKKLKEFQAFYGLPETGIADDKTLTKLDEVFNTPLSKGMRRPDVIDLKKNLEKAGFGGIKLTNYYGNITEERVKEFQQRYNLTADGVAGEETLKKLEEVINQNFPTPFSRIMLLQDTGEDVRLLQTYLNDAGFKVVDQPTNYYGSITENQVRLFQQQYGLTPTGVADGRTLQKLVSVRESVLESINSFLISGKGYGHAVGMTQYGAYGMAEAGYSYDEILKYYYSGTEIGTRDTENQMVRVLLTENASTLTISSNQPYYVGDKEFAANTNTVIQYQNGEYIIKNSDNTYIRSTQFQISSTNNGLLYFDNMQYEGIFYVSTNKGNLDLVNHLNVENYLKGVVPYEIIPSWNNLDLFKAQTLAARTYVLKEIQRNYNNKFDVYDTVRSQVYHGIPKDIPIVYVNKIFQAIEETKGQVILYKGTLIDAVYSASSGGHTVDAVDVWGNDVPYLVAKEDPYDTYKYSQNWWSYTITKQDLQNLFPNVGKIIDVKITQTKYNRPTEIMIVGEYGSITVSGKEFRSKIGLNNMLSNTFTIEGI